MEEQNQGAPKFNPPQVDTPEPEKVPDAPLPNEVSESKTKSPKKKLLVVLLAALLVILGAVAGWYFFVREDSDKTEQQSQAQESPSAVEIPVYEGLPDFVAYAYRETDNDPYILYYRPATGGDRVEAMTLPEGSYISQSAVWGNKVAVVVEPSATRTDPLTILYSSDSGRSYRNVYEGKADSQVTSLVFSRDETALLAGVLEADGGNKVTNIPLDGSEPTVVFETGQRGVFLEGYDSQAQKIVYFEGCYNCDGNTFSELKLHDGVTNVGTTIYASESGGLEVEVHPDFTKVLVMEGQAQTSDEAMGIVLVPPFEIKEIDLSDTANIEAIKTVSSQVKGVGYSHDGRAYYVGTQSVVDIDEAAGAIYETTGSIMESGVYYVGQSGVVVATGDFSDFIIQYQGDTAAEPAGILSGDANTVIFGVTIR